ncbi:hypothetical protein [Actinomadura sp. NAK00032]|uniref:hypothetical protein n=1 Tax=Actinomadura sp. NAK00032 TaxID=2742128 RepID=UPI001C37CBF3|nr:hypothetical protein [Actinomadura sp. NAK00032]
MPEGVRASYVVFDARAGRVLVERQAGQVFRSASVVKILIALDYLERHRASAADRALLKAMLRSSDDGAATEFWGRGGQGEIVERMVRRLGLRETVAPPAEKPGFWGYTALSARDVVTMWRHVDGFVLEQLRRATPRGSDGFDQTFGIPRAADGAAVKQGWSGFEAPSRPSAVRPDLGLGRPVLHTTGMVGDKIVVVLTLWPAGTSYRRASNGITALTRDVLRAA